jgi:4-oxalocrotonate tautomerase family enzyme
MTSPIQESFMSIIQVFFIAGRTDAQKERLISALTEAAVATIGIDRNEVRVSTTFPIRNTASPEKPPNHWGAA